MAAFIKDIRYRARQPRLGRWWRLWIAGSAWWTVGNVGFVIASEGWQGAIPHVPMACTSIPAFFLALGLTIDWIRKGARP